MKQNKTGCWPIGSSRYHLDSNLHFVPPCTPTIYLYQKTFFFLILNLQISLQQQQHHSKIVKKHKTQHTLTLSNLEWTIMNCHVANPQAQCFKWTA